MVEAGGRVLGYPSRVSRRTFLGRTLVWSAALGGSGVAAWGLNPAFAAFESTLGPVAGGRGRIIDVTAPPTGGGWTTRPRLEAASSIYQPARTSSIPSMTRLPCATTS